MGEGYHEVLRNCVVPLSNVKGRQGRSASFLKFIQPLPMIDYWSFDFDGMIGFTLQSCFEPCTLLTDNNDSQSKSSSAI